MSEGSDNKVESGTSPDTSIVRFGEPGESRRESTEFVMGIVWCAVGGLTSVWLTFLCAVVMGYGVAILTKAKGRTGIVIAAAVTVASTVVAGLLLGNASIILSVFAAVVSVVVGSLAAMRKATITRTSACVVAMTIVALAMDAWSAANAGVSLRDQYLAVFEAMYQGQGSSISDTMVVTAAERVLSVLWPTLYTLEAIAMVVCAHVGGVMGRSRGAVRPEDIRPAPLAQFDAPRIWPRVVLLVGAALMGLSYLGVGPTSQLFLVGANILTAIRIIFAIQGFAVLAGLLDRWHWGCLIRALAIVLAVDLELSFLVMSVVGLLDYWGNFRHLPRGAGSGSGSTAN